MSQVLTLSQILDSLSTHWPGDKSRILYNVGIQASLLRSNLAETTGAELIGVAAASPFTGTDLQALLDEIMAVAPPAAGTTAQFLRGDNAWTNALLGPLGIGAEPLTGARVGVTNNGSGTNQYGLHVAAQSGATNNFGVHLNNAAASNVWNFYAAGTASNYFAGSVGVGTTILTGASLYVEKTMTGSIVTYGVRSSGTVQSDSTAIGIYFGTVVATQAAAFSLTDLYHYRANQGTFGAGSTVTNQYGFRAENTLAGATNNYGFFSNIAAAAGRWNFYAAGTARNYFAGSVGIGSTTDEPSALLYVTSTTQGFAPPRMTTAQRDAISAPVSGLIVYNTTTGKLNVRGASAWEAITSA